MTVYTWNMEHGGNRWPMLNSFPNAEAICLQETSARFGGLVANLINGQTVYLGMHQIGSRSRGTTMSLAIASFGATGMNSVGVMVAGGAAGVDVIPPPAPNTRATPGLQHAGGTWVYSIHAPSVGGNAWQMGWIGAVLAVIAGRGHAAWICAGDFNASPAAVAAVSPGGSVVVHPGAPTQKSGGELDFAVCTPGVVNSAEVGTGFNSDHWPVKLT